MTQLQEQPAEKRRPDDGSVRSAADRRGGTGLLCREHAVDIHSHTVYGVDDGSGTLEEAAELLRLDREEGMDVVFSTPHFGIENGYAPDARLVASRFSQLEERAADAAPGVRLYLGTEWYCAENIVDRIRRHEAWPMHATDYYLVEFLEYQEMSEPAETMIRRLSAMRKAGYHPILAHPERYRAAQEDWTLIRRLHDDLGVLMQVNAYDICLNTKARTRDLAQWMAEERLIAFIGSDMHGLPPKRTPRMREGIQWLYGHTDPAYADGVVRRNAEKYLGVEPLPAARSLDGSLPSPGR